MRLDPERQKRDTETPTTNLGGFSRDFKLSIFSKRVSCGPCQFTPDPWLHCWAAQHIIRCLGTARRRNICRLLHVPANSLSFVPLPGFTICRNGHPPRREMLNKKSGAFGNADCMQRRTSVQIPDPVPVCSGSRIDRVVTVCLGNPAESTGAHPGPPSNPPAWLAYLSPTLFS